MRHAKKHPAPLRFRSGIRGAVDGDPFDVAAEDFSELHAWAPEKHLLRVSGRCVVLGQLQPNRWQLALELREGRAHRVERLPLGSGGCTAADVET